MTIQNYFFVKKNLPTKLVKKHCEKKIENQLFLLKFLKIGHLEGKAYGESKKIRNSKKKLKHSSGLFLT
jgi:hypothetical protein